MRPDRVGALKEFLSQPMGWRTQPEFLASSALVQAITLFELRDAHFARGLRCPRCTCTRVQRWGGFSGRRRYRCLGCGRTFSDLTGTALAYTKLPTLWAAFTVCMAESLTVRAAAGRLGIDKDTAWRWRHRILEAELRIPIPRLRGIIETHELRLHTRTQPRDGWSSSWFLPDRHRPKPQWLLIARDRLGTVRVSIAGARRPTTVDFTALLGARPVPGSVVLDRFGGASAGMRYAARTGSGYHPARRLPDPAPGSKLFHLGNVIGYQRRLRQWLRRFRGVAAKYLPRYLRWHALLDERRQWPGSMILDPLPLAHGRHR